MTLTSDYTYQYMDSGIVLNTDVTPTLPFVDVLKISGLDSAPIRESSRVREGADGGFSDMQYEDQRVIVLEGIVYSPPSQIEVFLDSLKGNYSPTFANQPFYFLHPSVGQRVVFCKSLGVKYDADTLRRTGKTEFQIQLKAEDPSIYGSQIVVVGGLAAASSGRGYNRSYNYGYGGTSGSAGSVNANNAGNKPATAIIKLMNVIDPVVVCDSVNKRITLSISLQGTDYLELDLRNRTAILNGTANRRSSVVGTSQWFLLQPGANLMRLLGTAGAGTPQMTVTYRPAYR